MSLLWGIQMDSMLAKTKETAKRLKMDLFALYFSSKHPDIPWYAKLFTILVVAYAFSPIDLIPDFIPILGYLDDLILIPLGIYIAIKLIPEEVLMECRKKAEEQVNEKKKIGL